MYSRWLHLLFTITIFAGISCPVVAQDTAPATEEPASKELTYFDLRRSRDHATKQFADRYFNLVKPQEWASLNGKSKITAEYVSHDPNLAWVKLATVGGTGANRTKREVTVEVAKLNKTCQSRVRQISVLQAKLDELVVAEQERKSESDTESRSEYGESGRYGEEMASERRGGTDEYGGARPTYTEATSESGERASEAATSDPVVPDGSDDPDPLGFAELASELSAIPAGGDPRLLGGPVATYGYGETTGAPAGAGASGGPVDRSQWKTSYDAFRANLLASQSAGGTLAVDWGELTDLRQMNEVAEAGSRSYSGTSGSQVAEIADRIGEVQWEATFVGLGESSDSRQEVQFDLPPVSPPLKLRFLADERESASWMAMRSGTPVRFAGRFDIREPLEIQVLVRKLD